MYDVLIVGGGPAGLSAALVLGRCRRRVLLCDDGHPRNAATRAVHNYLGHEGVGPIELRRIGREEVARYGVELTDQRVVEARCERTGRLFEVTLADGRVEQGRKMLLATGVEDQLPGLPGLAPLWGRSVHHCPYCDGYEWRDQPIAVYGRGEAGLALAMKLKTWTRHVTLCTNGPTDLDRGARQQLSRAQIALRSERITRLEAEGERLRAVRFHEGRPLKCSAMFCATKQAASDLPERIGCRVVRAGLVETSEKEQSNVPGVWVAGDASRDVQFAIVAAGEGAIAGVAINEELRRDNEQGLGVEA